MKKAMLAVSALTMVILFANAATAQEYGNSKAQGDAELTKNGDETVLVIRGKAAIEMYNRLDIAPRHRDFDEVKAGRNIVCIANDESARCILSLGENASGLLTGEVQ